MKQEKKSDHKERWKEDQDPESGSSPDPFTRKASSLSLALGKEGGTVQLTQYLVYLRLVAYWMFRSIDRYIFVFFRGWLVVWLSSCFWLVDASCRRRVALRAPS